MVFFSFGSLASDSDLSRHLYGGIVMFFSVELATRGDDIALKGNITYV